MREDDRGRIPFAVLAVLLLVSSAVVATTMGASPTPAAPAVDVVVDRAESEQRTALRRAVRQAATEAAGDPVIDRANTTVGQALGEEHTFRDSLRLRAYVAARDQLAAIEREREGLVATTSLPPIDGDDRQSVRAAIDRVGLASRGDNATAVTVTFDDVTTTVRKNGRVVDQRDRSVNVTVATPVLSLHDRVATYQERLDAGVTEPGLTQRLTAIMNAAGWARGYAQYYGAPIGNVISNGHVRVATNAALLDVQRSTLGKVDDKAVGALGEDVAKVSAQETVSLTPGSSPFLSRAISNHDVTRPNDVEGVDVPERDSNVTVGVNRSADDSFAWMVGDVQGYDGFGLTEDVPLNETIEATYTADLKLATATIDSEGVGRPRPTPPGPGWSRADTAVERRVSVADADRERTVGDTGEWHAFDTFSREVTITYEVGVTWVRNGETRSEDYHGEETKKVSVSLLGRHAPGAPGPEGEILGVHENGSGPLSGPNLQSVESNATGTLLAANGGRERIARAAATGTLEPEVHTAEGEIPEGIRPWIYRDLMALREEIEEIRVSVRQRDVGTFAVNPPTLLKEKLEDQRRELLDASPPYDGVADRARVAARARYLSMVSDHLERRADERSKQRDTMGDELGENASVEDLQNATDATVEGTARPQAALDGPGGPVHLQVDAAPSYLDFDEVTESAYPAVDGSMRPLYAKNVNQFQMPYGEAAAAFMGVLSGPERTSLSTAATTLRTARDEDVDVTVEIAGETLDYADSVEGRIDKLVTVSADTLDSYDVGGDDAERESIVRDSLSRWETTTARAFAFSNGSAAPAIAAEAGERGGLSTVEEDKLRIALDGTIRSALDGSTGRPREDHVEFATKAVKSDLKGRLADTAEETVDAAVTATTNGTLSKLPSGMPLAPLPGYWYATANVWTIKTEGEYARFGLRASRGRPTDPGAGTMYARDGEAVSLDIDEDGRAERLGRSTRVSFESTVHVVVVVPPGPQGVGDTGGDRNETSPGWPPP